VDILQNSDGGSSDTMTQEKLKLIAARTKQATEISKNPIPGVPGSP
jgi:hypothetical protein